MRSTEHAASKGAAISPKKKKKISDIRKKVLITQSVLVSIMDVAIALIVCLIANIVCNGTGESSFVSYFTMLFIPLISFLTAFASFVFTKNLKVSVIANIVLTVALYLIFNGCGWSIFLWELLYIVNAVLGYVIALAARSYKA